MLGGCSAIVGVIWSTLWGTYAFLNTPRNIGPAIYIFTEFQWNS